MLYNRGRFGRQSAGVRGDVSGEGKKRGGWSWWYLLFLAEFVVALWPPLYNRAEPTVLGIPFFYWFQLFWVVVSAVFTAVVYFATAD